MADNPFVVVGTPSYGAPLLDFSVLSGNQKKLMQPAPAPNNNIPPQQQQPNAVFNFGQGLRRWLSGTSGPASSPSNYQTTPGPLDLTSGTLAGANNLTSGLY